jgi:alpha-tubulin suppressor-like RCC1 family protein
VVIQSRAIHMEKCGEMALFFLDSEADVQQLIDKRHLASSSGTSPVVFATLCSALIFMETFMMSAGSSGSLSYSLAMFQAAVEYIKTYKQGSAKPRTRIKAKHAPRKSSAIADRFVVAARHNAVRNNCYVWGITGALSSSAAGGSLPEIMNSLNIVTSISCGSKHCLAIDRQGRCFSWGWGGDGQLGHGSCDDLPNPTHVANIQETVVQVAGGSGHSVALTFSGAVFTWGMHLKGQLGRDVGHDSDAALLPGLVSDLDCVCDISAGGDSTFAFSEQNGLFAWGCNIEGQLGLDNKQLTVAPVPQEVAALANVQLLSISVASSHALFIDLQSRVWGCGSNANGQLGYGSDRKSVVFPTLLPSLQGISISSVACGFSCSLFLTAAGQVMTPPLFLKYYPYFFFSGAASWPDIHQGCRCHRTSDACPTIRRRWNITSRDRS